MNISYINTDIEKIERMNNIWKNIIKGVSLDDSLFILSRFAYPISNKQSRFLNQRRNDEITNK